ncbi:hypothetical protein HPB50_003562 [Hyalomma asiaticum]|uniref:Uncharacterized protein n=1 Tax=Hyalomma asiaticum TaxID=266040 RepID=A0ACB7SR88_HYAAI|nr:hypothetical protein HPB50_003562 [Hyalomma asiaticum]
MTAGPRRVDALLAEVLESSGARARSSGHAKTQGTGMQLLLRLRLMFAESAIPGLRVILGLSHPVRRLAWTAAMAALVCIGLNDLYIVFRSVFCGDIELNRSTATEWQQKICGRSPILPIWLREDDFAQREEFSKWITELQRRNETTAKLLGHQRENMVVSCLVGGKDCNKDEYLQVKVYGRYGNCFCLGCNLSAETEKIQTAYSPDQGVRLLLNLEIKEYLSHTTEAGFVVNVHQPGVQVDFRDSIFLLPCHTTMISVTQSIYFRLEPPYRNPCQRDFPEKYREYISPDRVYTRKSIYFRLEPPYRNPCQRDFPEKYREYISPDRVYTRKACRHICAQLHVIAACGCQSHDYDTIDRSLAEICNEDDEELSERNVQADSKTLTEVVVYLASAQGYRRKNDPKVTVPRLISGIGSIMGMYVGMSFLLIFNVFDIIARALVASYKQFRRVQKCHMNLQGISWNPHNLLPGYGFLNWRGFAPYMNKASGRY